MRDKVSFLVLLLCLGSSMTAMANSTQSPPAPNSARLLLAELRHGDYAHAGDEEAIDLVIQKLLTLNPQIKAGPTLDVGSGFGGTLHYLVQKGFKKVQGIDRDASAVAYAKQRYPKISFHTLDALKVDTLFKKPTFSLLTLFNVIYAIPDKATLLSQLYKISKPGAVLMLFDYSLPASEKAVVIYDLAGKPMYPIFEATIAQDLETAGWTVISTEDWSDRFIGWYADLLEKIEVQEKNPSTPFKAEDLKKLQDTFAYIQAHLQQKRMGARVIYARKA